jgi:hypothetical protein
VSFKLSRRKRVSFLVKRRMAHRQRTMFIGMQIHLKWWISNNTSFTHWKAENQSWQGKSRSDTKLKKMLARQNRSTICSTNVSRKMQLDRCSPMQEIHRLGRCACRSRQGKWSRHRLQRRMCKSGKGDCLGEGLPRQERRGDRGMLADSRAGQHGVEAQDIEAVCRGGLQVHGSGEWRARD